MLLALCAVHTCTPAHRDSSSTVAWQRTHSIPRHREARASGIHAQQQRRDPAPRTREGESSYVRRRKPPAGRDRAINSLRQDICGLHAGAVWMLPCGHVLPPAKAPENTENPTTSIAFLLDTCRLVGGVVKHRLGCPKHSRDTCARAQR